MEQDNITPDTVPEDTSFDEDDSASESDEGVSQPPIKDIIGDALDRKFKDNESALKAVKDTFSHVSEASHAKKALKVAMDKFGTDEQGVIKALEGVKVNEGGDSEFDPKNFLSKDKYEEDMFFTKNSQYEPYRDVLGALKEKSGKNWNDTVDSESFKKIYTKARSFDEIEESKSVLQSNPRLGEVKDKMSQAREALKQDTGKASGLAVDAVLGAYPQD